MKAKISTPVILLAGMLMAFDGCKKYPEGAALGMHSGTEKIASTWKLDKYTVNGTDYTSLVTGYTETYTKDGNFSYSFGSIAGTGNWSFQHNDSEVRILGTNNQSDNVLTVLKLNEKEFWYYCMDGKDKKEFHMTAE